MPLHFAKQGDKCIVTHDSLEDEAALIAQTSFFSEDNSRESKTKRTDATSRKRNSKKTLGDFIKSFTDSQAIAELAKKFETASR